jgi:hypothetical protein
MRGACHPIAVAIALCAVACDQERREPSDEGAAIDEGTGEAPQSCPGMGGPADIGEPCVLNTDCASGVCSIYRDAPRNDDAVCVETPPDCATRMTGTVLDFDTLAEMPAVPVVMVAAPDAIADAGTAPAIVVLETGPNGRFDGTSDGPIAAQLAVLALTATDGYDITASGVAQPPAEGGEGYEVGTGLHDVWIMPRTTLTAWSDALAADETIDPELLPLADKGVVAGMVRDGVSGQPIAGAVVSSTTEGSAAIVRYVADDGTLGSEATASSGKFIVLRAGTPETFVAFTEVEVGRAVVGFVPDATFVTMLQSAPVP